MSARQNKDLKVNKLHAMTRQKICEKLNIPNDGEDFRTFAAKIDMPNDRIALISKKDDPTEAILRWWEPKKKATVKNLRRILEEMDKDDILNILDEDPSQGNQQEVANTTSTDGVDATDSGMTENEPRETSKKNTPPPEIQLVEMEDINATKIEWSKAKEKPTDVLLVVATEIEFRAAYQILPKPKSADSNNDLGEVYFDQIGKNRVALLKSLMGACGNAGMQRTCREGIKQLNAKTGICVGICFGMKDKKQKLGDVVVSTMLASYESSRVNSDGSLEFRGTIPECDARIKKLFDLGKARWKSPGRNELKPVVHCGLMISGEKLIDNKDLKEKLQEQFPAALAGEMEGGGLQSAFEEYKRPWIVCKAISDWGDGTKNKEWQPDWQPFAAVTAASYVKHVLEQYYVPGEEENVSGRSKRPAEPDKDEIDAGGKRPKPATELEGQPKLSKIHEINETVYGELCENLNYPIPHKDYKALAGAMGYSHNEVRRFSSHSNPAEALLDNWKIKSENDVPCLIQHLEKIGREDLVELLLQGC